MPKKKRKALTYRKGLRKRDDRKKRKNLSEEENRRPVKRIKLPTQKLIWTTCVRCEAPLLTGDPKGFCCGANTSSEDHLIELPTVPPALANIYLNNRDVQKHARKYNNTFAFSAIGTSGEDGFYYVKGGPSNLIMHGQVYHRMPNADQNLGPLRWILWDGQYGKESAQKHDLNMITVNKIKNILVENYPYWNDFVRLSEQPAEEAALVLTGSTSEEIAAIIMTEVNDEYLGKSVVCYRTNEEEGTFIKPVWGMYLPLQYVLVCPDGTLGWDLSYKKRFGLTILKFYRQFIMRCTTLHHLGPLLNEFMVDFYSAVEQSKLDYCRFNQKIVCPKKNLADSSTAGRVCLPSSFVGSRRYFAEKTSDALAIVREFGKPTFFITMTTNPNWPEITEQLLPGQTASDRPDIVARVFHAKLRHLLKILPTVLKGGKKMYLIYVIEFQKRGLPHAHIAVKFEVEPRTTEQIDDIISAELPIDDPELEVLVKRWMIHEHRPERCFRRSEECKYGFPKEQIERTFTDAKGFVNYRRRKTSDSNIVSYCGNLLKIFDCHINVDISYSVTMIMYLYKYFYKGYDKTKGTIQADEITAYLEGRYLSASEAAWRFFEFEITRRDPSVKCYSVHLPNENYVAFEEGEELTAVENVSTQERYFQRPDDPRFDNLTYEDYFRDYAVEKKAPLTADEIFKDKCPGHKQCNVYERMRKHIPRLASVRPQSGEVWYLRLLLKHRAARNYSDLLTVNGVQYSSYSESARAFGLLEDGTEWHLCLEEAVADFCTPYQLRSTFVSVVNEGAPARELFDIHIDYMIQDFIFHENMNNENAYQKVLNVLAAKFESCGRTLESMGLPEPDDMSTEIARHQATYNAANCEDDAALRLSNLNQEQRIFVENICTDIAANAGGFHFLDGPAGRGKTYTLITIINILRGKSKIALCCASSAAAALLYPGGRTAHSLFKIDVRNEHSSPQKLQCTIPMNSQRAELLRQASVLIWDEFVMTSGENFEAVDEILRKLRNKPDQICGGLVFIAAGDFRQTTPIVTNGTKQATIRASVKFSDLWKEVQLYSLTVSMRQMNDLTYSAFIDEIGNGTYPVNEDGRISVSIINYTTNEEDFIRFVYPELDDGKAATNNSAILSLRNAEVDHFNESVVSHLPGEDTFCYSYDSLNETDESKSFFDQGFNDDFYHSLNVPNVPPHILKLKPGMECYVLRNIMPDDGLVNNAHIRILQINRHNLKVFVFDTKKTHYIPRISFNIDLPKKSFRVLRKQFSVRPAYAKTFNRSQGSTYDKCAIDLRDEPFGHGQLLVGCSRVRSSSDILALVNTEQIQTDGSFKTVNVVFKELLE